MARTAWLIGFCTEKGFFQVQSNEIEGLYMDSIHTQILHFNGNNKAISTNGTDSNMINLDAIRSHFEGLCNYDGPTRRRDPRGFASHLGFFVVLLMESKCKWTCQRHCSALMGNIDFSTDDDWVTDAITNWSSISQQCMWSLDDSDHKPTDCGIRALKNFDQLMGVFYYIHVDGYFTGIFEHTPMDRAPRKLTWDPVDVGVGDGDIVVHQEPNTPPSIRSRGARKRVCTDEPLSLQERRSKKPRGLSGGGLGGPPEAPDVFRLWADAVKDDKKICDALIRYLNKLGLDVREGKRKLGIYNLEQSGKRHEGSADIVEANNLVEEC